MTHGDPSVNALYGAYARGEITLETLRESEKSGQQRLDRAAPDAGEPRAADRLYRPGDFDHLRPSPADQVDDGRRLQGVDILTSEELRSMRLRLLMEGEWVERRVRAITDELEARGSK